MTLPKTSTFSVFDDDKEVARLITVAKNMGYKYKVQVDKVHKVTAVTWIRRA
jgi:hypothetical protein